MSNTKELGVCMVGAGDMGTRHAHSWSTIEGVKLVAVADIIAGRARSLASQYDMDYCVTDYKEVAGLDEVDVVTVCVPTFFHPEVTVFAAEHGKHVMCEKAIALSLEAADRMMEAAGRNGVKLGLGFQRRASKWAAELAKLLREGEIGRPVMYRQMDAWQIRAKREAHDMARGFGGPVVDMCCHYFDLWRMIFDSEPVRVTARGFTFAEGREELAHIAELAPDTAAIIVEHGSGDIGVVTITWGLPPGVRGLNTADVLGPDGVILFPNLDEITILKEGGKDKKISGLAENWHAQGIQYFAKSILEGEPLRATGEDGKRALRVSLAALESMKTGQPVVL